MSLIDKYLTKFLKPAPTFLTGAGSCINLGGNFYKPEISGDPGEFDRIALLSDFESVGKDFEAVLSRLEEQDDFKDLLKDTND